MSDVSRSTTSQTIEHLHQVLHEQFSSLRTRRLALAGDAPVFALEHGLSQGEIAELREAVKLAYRDRLPAPQMRASWLPFVVHAAEVAYGYDGVEYWPLYQEALPDWTDTPDHRDLVKRRFVRFSTEYGGAVPRGPWAETFTNIAWPITHAVLPSYLQLQFAQMLWEHKSGWTGLLDDSHALGLRLHQWSSDYSDRLEKFCQNTDLAGNVAAGLLLAGGDHETRYITPDTLNRLVDSLTAETRARRWLRDAQRTATITRQGNLSDQDPGNGTRRAARSRAITAPPRLLLRSDGSSWTAYVDLPDLRSLHQVLPEFSIEMQRRRAAVNGSAARFIPAGGLAFATSPQELATWPDASRPLVRLQDASVPVNELIADACRMTSGPWWVFRPTPEGTATEIRGATVRPGNTYIIVALPNTPAPKVAFCSPASLTTTGVDCFRLEVPAALQELDASAIAAAGISVSSSVSIRPVGLVPAAWDGQGNVEYFTGEPVTLAIESEQVPIAARISLDGVALQLPWPEESTTQFVSLGLLEEGTHNVVVEFGSATASPSRIFATANLLIRDAQQRGAGASVGEGVRIRATPSQPTLPELWDQRATLEIDGPTGVTAELDLLLRNDAGKQLADYARNVELPVSDKDWLRLFEKLRRLPDFERHYDESDVVEIEVGRAGVGLAKLKFERGFQPLRWVLRRNHRDSSVRARLIDRTDGAGATSGFYPSESPTTRSELDTAGFNVPVYGGLLTARAGAFLASQIVSPDPNAMFAATHETFIPDEVRSVANLERLCRIHQMWHTADLPADVFGKRTQDQALRGVTATVVSTVAGVKWRSFEEQIAAMEPDEIDLDMAGRLIGPSADHEATARAIGHNAWQWNDAETFIEGFHDAARKLLKSSGCDNTHVGALFALRLASAPDELLNWDSNVRGRYLDCFLKTPAVVKAARHAVLSTPEDVAGGVG